MDTREELARLLFETDVAGKIWPWDDLLETGHDIWREQADAILASPVVAHIRAEALREAADAVEADDMLEVDGHAWVYDSAAWLRARADREEQG